MGLLEKMIESWPAFFRGIALLSSILFVFYLFAVQVVDRLHPSAVSISTDEGLSLKFDGAGTYKTILIHPRGWQSSGIKVKSGDELIIDAGGSINIAMGRMVQSLEVEYKYKARNEKAGKGRDVDAFSRKELEDSLFAYPWNGPEGIQISSLLLDSAIKRVKDSQSKRVAPFANVGQLLMVISKTDSREAPNLNESQVVPYGGKGSRVVVKEDGYIWFIVNDLKPDKDQIKRELDWQDNLGMFDVKLLINSKNK